MIRTYTIDTDRSVRRNESTWPRRVSGTRRKKLGILLVVTMLIGGSVSMAYGMLSSPATTEPELATVLAAVSRHMVLPDNEEPVLSIVTDADALKVEQAFFIGVENGDQVLLFPKSLKAIIYSPARDRIINVGPIEQSKGQ